MQDWIIEADIYRLRKQLADESTVASRTHLRLLLLAKEKQLATLKGDANEKPEAPPALGLTTSRSRRRQAPSNAYLAMLDAR